MCIDCHAMPQFFDSLSAARQDFFKLRKHRQAPAWAMWVMTVWVSLLWGLGLMAGAAFLASRQDSSALSWEHALPFLLTTLMIGAVFHVVYTVIERLAPQRFIDWTNGEPGVLVSLFFSITSMACVAAGLALAYLLLGSLPGMGRVDWTPQRTWLSIAMTSVFVSVIFGLVAWQDWHEEQLKRQSKEAELKLLQAQIEPHYLFNTLANVRSLIDFAPREAGEMLDAFTEHLRASLTSMRAELVPLDAELALVGHYLRLMQLRMGERLTFSIDATADARAELVPPLLLQPLVENAIHHGLECKVKPGSVQVLARVEAGHLHLCVQDDGVGLDAPQTRKGSGVATQNIRDRLRGRYGSRATFKLEPASPEGTRAIIDLPLTP